jgi:hypothetical protein
MDKHRPPQLDEELPALDGPDYLTLVIEWGDGMAAAPRDGMSTEQDSSWDRVDEASLESFPASDPPAWGSAHAVADPGIPEDLADEITTPFEPRSRRSAVRRIALGIAAIAAIVSMIGALRRLRPRA